MYPKELIPKLYILKRPLCFKDVDPKRLNLPTEI